MEQLAGAGVMVEGAADETLEHFRVVAGSCVRRRLSGPAPGDVRDTVRTPDRERATPVRTRRRGEGRHVSTFN